MSNRTGSVLSLCATALLTLTASTTSARTFDFDVGHVEGMRTLRMDAPVGTPVYVSSYALCLKDSNLRVIGRTRLESDDMLYRILRVTIEVPYGADFDYDDSFGEDDCAFEDERSLALWTMLQSIPCTDWGDLASDPWTLLPVATIHGTKSMPELLATQPPAK